MLTPPGATGSGPTSHSQTSIFSKSNWMPDSLSFARAKPDNQGIQSSATPRRYTPPSPNTTDLNEFFGPHGTEWHGVKIQRLTHNITKQDVKTMFIFSSGLEDVRVIRNDQASNTTEAYVKLKTKESAEEAERLLNGREMNGSEIIVTVVPHPQSHEITRMATSNELYAADYSSQSPSSSDGLVTPAVNGNVSKGEYITTSARHISPPATNGHGITNGMNGLGRLDTGIGGDLFQSGINGVNRINGNVNMQSDQDVLPVIAALDRMAFTEQATNGLSGINGTAYEGSYMDTLSMLPSRSGLSSFHEQQSENDAAITDNYGPMTEPMSAYPRPRRQTNPAQVGSGRFGNLPPLATGGVNGFSNASMAPMTAPPIAAPQLTSPLSMNSPSTWSSTTAKPFYNSFPITSHPPANPADQNPPCNTLYVGNLPAQTSEDELKALFCRQRGYKRMCFRTKPQGPMCFVEFEDTHYATKALTELYGRALSNSTKGGVRLSFSKNPLGVRSQNNLVGSNGTSNSAKTSSSIPGASGVPSHAFPTPLRTPPGLPTPTSRQMSSLNTPTTTEPSGPPPGLFPSSTSTPQSLREQSSAFARPGALSAAQSSSRLPPGIPTSNSAFFAGSDLRSPVDLRSPADIRSPNEMRGPGPGTIGCPPGR